MSFPNSYFSTNTAVVLFDASGRNGTVTLPHTQSTIGRVVTLKETTGAVRPGGASSGDGTRAADSTSFSNSAPIRAISGLQLWLDAADNASLMISSTRVLQWTDKSSNAFVFDSVTTNYPTLSTINGIQAVNVEGPSNAGANTQRFYNSAFTLTQANYTIYAVGKQKPNIQSGHTWLFGAGNSTARIFMGGFNGNFATFTGNGTWNDTTANVPNYSVSNPFIGGMTISSSILLPYYNGSNQTQKTGTTGSFTGLYVGEAENNNTGFNWNGQIGEILIFNQTLTPEDRRTVEGYLGYKWSLNSNLPASHIYRSLNPATPVGVSDISGLRLWLDGTDNTKLSLTGGSNVMSWTDKSSNAYVFSSVTTNYPTVSSINGVQAVKMVGSSVRSSDTQRMYNATFTLNNNNYTVFVAAKQNSGASSWTDVNYILGASPDFRLVFGGRLGNLATFTGSGSTWNDTAANVPNYSVINPFIGAMSVNGSTLIPYYDGSNQNTKTGTTGTISGMFIGDTTAGFTGQNWNGQIGEVIIYDQTLSAYHRQSVEKYLANKWGLFSNLPSTSISALSTITIPQYINSGLSMWLDAADSSTYISSSGAVSAWNSKTTFRGITVSQATASNRPQIALGIQNGLNVMRMSNAASATYATLFNNTVASSNVATSNSVAVFIVHNPTMNNASPFSYQNAGNNRIIVHTPNNTNVAFDWNSNGTASRLNYSLGAGCNAYINEGFKLECFYISGGIQGYRKNGTLLTSQAATTASFAASQALTIGAFNPTDLTFYYRTDIGEILWYKSALSQSQIELAEGYLAWKWGLNSALASDHPYKNSDPFSAGSQYNSTITLSTMNTDSFEDGSTRKILTNNFGHITLLAGEDRKWYQLSGTQPLQQTISSLAVSSIQGDGNYLTDIPRASTLASTVAGLGTALYISSSALTSTVANYIANAGGITAASLASTVGGLGRSTYVSTSQLTSTVAFITSNVSTTVLDSTELISSVGGLGRSIYISTPTLNFSMASTVAGLGTAGYVSTIGPNFTFSTLTIPNDASISTLNTNVAAITDFNTSSMMASNYTLYKPSSVTSEIYVVTGTTTNASNFINWSSDGSNWYSSLTYSVSPGTVDRSQVRYLSTNLFGVGCGAGFYISSDGKNWTRQSGNPFYDGYFTDIAYNGTYLVAIGAQYIFHSSNLGVSWASGTNNTMSEYGPYSRYTSFALSYKSSTGMFIAAGGGMKYTTNPATGWSNTTGNSGSFNDIALGGVNQSRWVAVGSAGGFYSDNGVNWSACTNIPSGDFTDYVPNSWTVAYSPSLNLWVFGGYQQLRTSADGITFSATNLYSGSGIGLSLIAKIEWLKDRFYAVGSAANASTMVVMSMNGSNWSPAALSGAYYDSPNVGYQNYATKSVAYGLLSNAVNLPTVFSSDGSRLLRNNVDYMSPYTKDINLQSTLVASNFISTPQLTSSVSGVSTFLDSTYVTIAEMTSTVTGLGTRYISTFPPTSLLSSISVGQNIYTSSLNTRYIQGSTMTTSSVTGNNVNFNISSVLEGSDNIPPLLQTGLVAYYDPGNTSSYPGSGSNFTSLVGTVPASLIGSFSYSASNGGTIRLNNTSTNFSLNLSKISLNTPVTFRTVSAWVFIHSIPVANVIFWRSASLLMWSTASGDSGIVVGGTLYRNGGSAESLTSANVLSVTGSWQHLTMITTANASEVFTLFSDNGVAGGGANVSFGPITVYNRVLTQAENTSNYSVFATRFGLTPVGGPAYLSSVNLTTDGSLLYANGSNIARNYIQTVNVPSTLSGYGFVSSSQLTSTVAGLNTYVSSFVDTTELASTVAGIGLANYISSLGLTDTFTSSVAGLGTATYISTPSLTSTLEGISTNLTSISGEFISSIIDNYYNHSTFTVQSTANFYQPAYFNNIYYEGSTFVTTDVLRSTMDAYFNQPTIYAPQDYSF